MDSCEKCGKAINGVPHITCENCGKTICNECYDTLQDKTYCPICGHKG